MKIARKPDRAALDEYNLALAINFALTPLVSFHNGRLAGSIDEDFLLSGLLSKEKHSSLILGVAWVDGAYVLHGESIPDEMVENFLINHLANVTGLKSVEYARHAGDEGEVIIATLNWGDLSGRIARAVGSNFETRGWNFVGSRGAESARNDEYDFSHAALDEYLERRRQVKPEAVELRLARNDLPQLLGFRDDSRNAAVAAFGSNAGVKSAIYYRPADETRYPVPGDIRFIRGSNGERLLPARMLTSARGASSGSQKAGQERFYEVGGHIFTVTENLREHICTASNVLQDREAEFPGFDASIFSEMLRELCVNAFAHGAWGTHLQGRDDQEEMVGPRLAIVHLENRIEVVNELREAGHIYRHNLWETTRRRSSVHNAFVDIGFAHGRTMGNKLVRHHATKMGLPAPIFVRDARTYRAIVPLSLDMPGWSVQSNLSVGQRHDPLPLYTLHLARFLGRLDEYVLASALYIRPQDARAALAQLVELGGLVREDRGIQFERQGFSEWLYPSYMVADPSKTAPLLAKLSEGLDFHPTPAPISLGGQYQLSSRSTPYLKESDRQEYLYGLYEFELLSSEAARAAAARHTDVLRSIPGMAIAANL